MGRITKIEGHFLRELYGVEQTLSKEQMLKLGKAILTVAGADGELTGTETNYFLGLMRGFGATEDMLEAWLKFDPQGQRMTDHLDKEMEPFARIVLYDALRVARADGVGQVEREAAFRMATLLKVDHAVVPAIEGLLGVEDALNAARIRVLSPTR